jgi:O-antigen/teichoic acid export membrane protein
VKPFDSNGFFLPAVQRDELRGRAVRNAGVTVFSQGLMFAIQLVGTFVLARLLTPGDFGIVTMVTTFSLLLVGFGLNGFTEAVLQRDEINHCLASNLFWINVTSGIILAIAFALSGSLLAKFYGDPRVTRIAFGLSFGILLSSTSVLHLTLLKRAMQFSVTSAADVAGRAISVVLSIYLGWTGWGYWALVAAAVVQPLVVSVAAFWACRWIPGLPRRAAGTGQVVRYALHVYGRYCFNYTTRNTDNLLVGWRFGTQDLGLYKKAYDLFLLPATQLVAPVTGVAISALSRLNRDWEEYKRSFLTGLGVLAFVGMGIGACLTVAGADLMRVLLGPGWEMSGKIFTLFGPGIGIMVIYGANGLIHLSVGTAERWFRWGLIEFAVTICFFFLALHWGPMGLAAAWTASFWFLIIPSFWYAGKPINLKVSAVIGAIWRYVLAAFLAAFLSAEIVGRIPALALASGAGGAAYRVMADSFMFCASYIGLVITLYGGTAPLRRLYSILRKAIPSRVPLLSIAAPVPTSSGTTV